METTVAGRGPAPKSERSRPNDTARRQAEFTKVSEDGVVRGPDLPEGVWHERTIAWFDTWRRSPMAQTFIAADWDFLIDTAFLHTEMWNGSPGLAAEIRLRVGKLAGTPEDRLRLRVQVETEAKEAAAPRAMNDDRRARLVSIVNE
jgi:hypothetical protein